jgi:hypothetical protein
LVYKGARCGGNSGIYDNDCLTHPEVCEFFRLAVFVTNGIFQIEGKKGPHNNCNGEREKASELEVESGSEEDESKEETLIITRRENR